jgi:hypothetical protein
MMFLSHHLFVHFKRLFKKRERILVISRLHVTPKRNQLDNGLLSKKRENVGVKLLCLLKFREQTSIELQCSSEMVE